MGPLLPKGRAGVVGRCLAAGLGAGEAVAHLELVALVYEGVQPIEVVAAIGATELGSSAASSVSLKPQKP
jgi:hypothetical protein